MSTQGSEKKAKSTISVKVPPKPGTVIRHSDPTGRTIPLPIIVPYPTVDTTTLSKTVAPGASTETSPRSSDLSGSPTDSPVPLEPSNVSLSSAFQPSFKAVSDAKVSSVATGSFKPDGSKEADAPSRSEGWLYINNTLFNDQPFNPQTPFIWHDGSRLQRFRTHPLIYVEDPNIQGSFTIRSDAELEANVDKVALKEAGGNLVSDAHPAVKVGLSADPTFKVSACIYLTVQYLHFLLNLHIAAYSDSNRLPGSYP